MRMMTLIVALVLGPMLIAAPTVHANPPNPVGQTYRVEYKGRIDCFTFSENENGFRFESRLFGAGSLTLTKDGLLLARWKATINGSEPNEVIRVWGINVGTFTVGLILSSTHLNDWVWFHGEVDANCVPG